MSKKDRPQGIYLYCWDYLEDNPICDDCNSELVDVPISTEEYGDIVEISNTIGFLEAMIELKEKDIVEYQLKLSQFKATQNQIKQQEDNKPHFSITPEKVSSIILYRQKTHCRYVRVVCV